jgi:hypothetical protein
MRFTDIARVSLRSTGEIPPAPVLTPTPARRLRDALEPIATQGWWAKGVHERLEIHGMEFFDAYVWGRAAALGEPAAGVVVATFGVFEPSFLTAVYATGRSRITRSGVLAAREAGAVESLTGAVETDDRIRAAADALLAATDRLDATARPLFAGLREVELPGSVLGRLWRGAELVREHRGDGHLAICIGEGLDPLEMSHLTELWLGYAPGEYSSSRGYGPDAIAGAASRLSARGWVEQSALTSAGRAAREAMETATDRTQQALVDLLGPKLDEVVTVGERVSAALVGAGAFPRDPRKRAAG